MGFDSSVRYKFLILNKMNDVTVRDVLLYLQEAGWSDLVDERWKHKLETEIKTKFEYISQEVLDEVLELVIY